MGFFNLLETFFFLSLGITFVLIIMLVYHFKGRLVTLEDKYHTMFEIMNSMVKEMKILRDTIITIQHTPHQEPAPQSVGGFPMDFMKLFQGGGPQMFPSHQNCNDDDDYYEEENQKIVVSDTELDSDDENDTDVKIISVDIRENEVVSLADLEEDENLIDQFEAEDDQPEYDQPEDDQPEDDQPEPRNSSVEQMDFRKMDVSYLRTMVLTRGLATDTKKMKKNDLIKLLE